MMAASPCCRALRLARTLPALVRGPLLRRPLLRFTVVLRSELMTVLISRNYDAPSLEGAGEAPSPEVRLLVQEVGTAPSSGAVDVAVWLDGTSGGAGTCSRSASTSLYSASRI